MPARTGFPRTLLSALVLAASLIGAGQGVAQSRMLAIFPEDTHPAELRAAGITGAHYEVLSTRGQTPSRHAMPSLARPEVTELQRDARRLLFNPPRSLEGETDLACMAVAVYHEARGEPLVGQKAVASVVLQRALVPERWGDRPCDVVRPVQFSFMTSRYGFPRIDNEAGWQVSWGRALGVAARTLVQGPMPELRGADHYHATYVDPYWGKLFPQVAQIGKHLFFADPESDLARPFR